MGYEVVKRDNYELPVGLASQFVHQYFDLKLYAELGLSQNLDDLDDFEIEGLRSVSIGINRFYKEERDKAKRETKRNRK